MVGGVAELCAEWWDFLYTTHNFSNMALALRGVKLIYLLPYSPDFNPIKECFSYMKSVIWRYGVGFHAAVESKDESAVTDFLSEVLSTVSQAHVKGWFAHVNYL